MKLNIMIKPVIIGGIITGVLVFIFSFAHIEIGCCCCFLYTLGGIITAYLLTQEYLPSDRDYLISGALSGGVAGFVSWLLYVLKEIVSILYTTVSILYIIVLKNYHIAGLYIESTIMNFIIMAFLLLIGFFVYLLLGAVFGGIGAILYRIIAAGSYKE